MTAKEYIDIYRKYPFNSMYKGVMKDRKAIRKYNKALIEKYHWLEPINDWSGKKITQCVGKHGKKGFWPGNPKKHPDYDYEYTILDSLPDGWRIAFGDDICEEINEELVKYNFQDRYRILEIKEKYGSLRWYDGETPVGKLSDDYVSIDVKWNEQTPKYDFKTECLKELSVENYFPAKDIDDLNSPEYEERNKNCITHYGLYKIVEPCKLEEIIKKYEKISENVCIKCGKPATLASKSWVSYYCDDCAKELAEEFHNTVDKMFEKKEEK